MKTKLSFLAASLFCAYFFSQTIKIDTEVPGNPAPANAITEYWYWAYGVGVTGSCFASNSLVTMTAKPNGLFKINLADPNSNGLEVTNLHR